MQEVTQEFMDKVQGEIGEFIRNHTKQELYEGALQRRIMLYPVSEVKDLLEDRQLKDREFWVEVKYPELNTSITHPGAFFRSNEVTAFATRRAPSIGEHNEEIYVGELGLSKDDLEILKQNAVI